jgi:hypothetical protein
MLKLYLNALRKWPLQVKCISSGFLFGFGDFIAQSLNGGTKIGQYDNRRLLAFSSYGCFFHASTQHYWFNWMEKNIAHGLLWDSKPFAQSLIRVSVQTLTFAPMSIVAVMTWMNIARGVTVKETIEKISFNYLYNVWLTGVVFWFPTMILVFRYVPLLYRVIATSTANIIWSAYLSCKLTF